MRIHLVRHGETAPDPPNSFYGGSEVPLSQEGKRQANCAAEFLQKEKVDLIVSSHLSRARYGAEQVHLRHTRADVDIVKEFTEIDRGRWVGHNLEGINKLYPGDWEAYLSDPLNWQGHGGESLQQLNDRVSNAWHQLIDRNRKKECIVVVAHMFPIRSIVGSYLEGALLKHFFDIKIPTASISTIELEKQGKAAKVSSIGFKPY